MTPKKSDQTDRVSQAGSLAWGWRWWLWLTSLVVWTIGLVLPSPGEAVRGFGGFSLTQKFIVAKSVHVIAYCFLTALAGWQQSSLRFRRWLLVILLVHGPATELIQRLASNRSGRVLDVALDYFGIVIGLLLTWKYWWEVSDPNHQADR